MNVLRTTCMTAAIAATLAMGGCGLFGGDKGPTPEELAERVSLSLLDQKLTADADQAATDVVLPAAVPATDWTQAGGGPAKFAGHLAAAPQLKVDWKTSIGEGSSRHKRVVATPVVKDGRIYVVDANQTVSAYDVERGSRIWRHSLESGNRRDSTAVGSGLAIAGDKLIVTSGYGFIAAHSLADGSQIWRQHVESPVSSSPVILGDRAYLTSTNNEMYAIDLATGGVVWTDQAIAETARILSSPSPAVTPELLVAPFSSGELIAYIPANGRRLWQDTLTTQGRFTPLSAINDIAGRPSIEDGVVYAASYSGVVTAIDARSGQRIWNILFGSRQGPVVSGNYLFVVGVEGQVACLNKVDGKVIWVRDLPAYRNASKKQNRIVWSGPLLVSDRLVVTSSEGELVALSAKTGETVGELKLGGEVYVPPIAAAGRIFVVSDSGQLTAIK
jgi:outer membrane protein assembly factor BamB